MTEQPPEKPKRSKRIHVFLLVCLGVPVVLLASLSAAGYIMVVSIPLLENPGTFHRERYEAVVDKVRQMSIQARGNHEIEAG